MEIIFPDKSNEITVDTFINQGYSQSEADYQYTVYLGTKIGEFKNQFRRQVAHVYLNQSYRGLKLAINDNIVDVNHFDEWLEVVCKTSNVDDTTRSGLFNLMERVISRIAAGEMAHNVEDVLALDEGVAQRLASAAGSVPKIYPDEVPEKIDGLITKAQELPRAAFEEYLQTEGLKSGRAELVATSIIQLPNGNTAYYIEVDQKHRPTIEFALSRRIIPMQKTLESLVADLYEQIKVDNGQE